mgnify:CR=1 FL=1
MADYLAQNYDGLNQGVIECIDVLKTIRLYSQKELRGIFSKEEWSFLADSLNGALVEGNFRCNASALVAHCEDAEMLDGMMSKHNVERRPLIDKISNLSGAQVEALYFRVELFWKSNTNLNEWADF